MGSNYLYLSPLPPPPNGFPTQVKLSPYAPSVPGTIYALAPGTLLPPVGSRLEPTFIKKNGALVPAIMAIYPTQEAMMNYLA